MNEAVEKIMEKVSSYQIFNYLFPGILLIHVMDMKTSFHIVNDDFFVQLFFYYFAGMIVSRIGSVLIEPVYKGFCCVVFASYEKYVEAAKRDEKIDLLSSENNMYRTMVSMFLCLMVVFGLDQWAWFHAFNETCWSSFLYLVILTLMFSKAYAKQTTFVRRRVHKVLDINDDEEVKTLKKEQVKRFKDSFKCKKNS